MSQTTQPDSEDLRRNWPQNLADMMDVAIAALQRANVEQPIAEKHAAIVMCNLATYFGGRSFYLPKGDSLERAVRDMEIYQESGRVPAADLARRFKISEQRIYHIIHEQRALRRSALNHER